MSNETSPAVSVVITVYNEEPRYLAEAIASVMAQTVPAHEIVVVEDGALRDYAAVYAAYPALRIVRQANQGLAAARNTGLAAAMGAFILFLDGDDRMEPRSLAINLRRLAAAPEAVMSYGAYRMVDGEGREKSVVPLHPVGPDPYITMLEGNCIGMHATVLYRREALLAAGGFDPSFRACEDYELYLRMARQGAILCGPEVLADYRHHGANMSADRAMMLRTVLRVLSAQQSEVRGHPEREAARARGRAAWKRYYARVQLGAVLSAIGARCNIGRAALGLLRVFRISPLITSMEAGMGILDRLKQALSSQRIDLNALRQRTPISRNFGYDRGEPVDRPYIARFLKAHEADIRGRVLEVGDNSYTRAFGGAHVETSEVLHVDPDAPGVTYCTDLTTGDGIPDALFDCIILTQTLHLIYDFHAAVRTLHRILKPGGVLLLTVPGVTTVDRGEWSDIWFWSFTPASLRRLMSAQFGEEAVEISAYGNVLTATAFLYGLAEADLTPQDYDYQDPQFPVIVAARVRKSD